MPENPPELIITPFNPLAPEHLGESVRLALLAQPCFNLGKLPSFNGAGVYAIYYSGDSPYYRPIAEQNRVDCRQPIYVGKAVPPGSRRGIAVGASGRVLFSRLSQHAESIRQVSKPGTPGHLEVTDFQCRFLVVEQIWIPLIESLSITQFKPPWNGIVDGFGHHDQGRTRRQQERSFWDTLHPGRPWAAHFQPNRVSQTEIAKLLQVYYTNPSRAARTRARKRGEPEELSEDEDLSE